MTEETIDLHHLMREERRRPRPTRTTRHAARAERELRDAVPTWLIALATVFFSMGIGLELFMIAVILG